MVKWKGLGIETHYYEKKHLVTAFSWIMQQFDQFYASLFNPYSYLLPDNITYSLIGTICIVICIFIWKFNLSPILPYYFWENCADGSKILTRIFSENLNKCTIYWNDLYKWYISRDVSKEVVLQI